MSEVEEPTMQDSDDFYCFAVFDPNTKELLYSKYNFDFEKFRNTNSEYINLTKNKLFYKFLILNGSNLWQAFSVKEELKQYFNPITESIKQYFDDYNYTLWGFNFNTLSDYVTWNKLMIDEFNLIYYDYFKQVPNVYEFLLYKDSKIYSKYNFNFQNYSVDFNVHGSKIAILSDFLLRLSFLSGNASGYIGFKNIPNKFKKYFFLDEISQDTLKIYLENNSIFSPFPDVERSPFKINYENYSVMIKNKYDISFNNVDEAKKYFLKFGQFQQDQITFNKKIDDEISELSKSICSVVSYNSYATGFLIRGPTSYDVYRGVKQVYLVTCYHLIEESKKDVLYVNCFYNETTTIKLMFRIIGYDKHTDVCIAMYDDTLDYNKTFFPEETYNIRNTLKLLNLYGDLEIYLGQQIFTIGNPGLIDNQSYVEGKIMDPNYSGVFNKNFVMSYPPTILTNIHVMTGYSGSPFFIRDILDNKLKCIGMINAKLGEESQFTMGLSSHLFRKLISNGIANWFSLVAKYSLNDYENISYYIQEIYPKKWLGINCFYYNPAYAPSINSAFTNFTLNGGIIVTNFILGFNVISKKYIYENTELSKQGVIKLDTPLLKSRMYNKFIFNNRVPIIIKSMKLFDLVNGVYKTFNLGKYTGQTSMDILTYGFMQTSTVYNDPKYTNRFLREYSNIIFEFYYYNGQNWVLDTEEIGGNDSSWYNEYRDSFGHIFLQHKFDYPNILIPYLKSFFGDSDNITPAEGEKNAGGGLSANTSENLVITIDNDVLTNFMNEFSRKNG